MGIAIGLVIAYLIAPALVAAVVWIVAAAIGLTLTAATIGLVLFATALLIAAIVRPIHRWAKARMSPVRRRHPRPAGWYQWR